MGVATRNAQPGSGNRWWSIQDDAPARTSDSRHALDHDASAFEEGERSGLLKRFARNGIRVYLGAIGGSGVSDVVRLKHGVEIDVNNFVLPAMRRRLYLADESLILLRASLACDVVFRQAQSPPIEFNRPELTMMCMPKGMEIVVDARGGVRQQGVNGIFRPAALAKAYGLQTQDLPEQIREALTGTARFGRLVSLPLDHRVASLIADTIETPLEGEMRALQYAGRMAELVAYTIDAVRRSNAQEQAAAASGRPVTASGARAAWRDADLAQLALERLSRQYRDPPLFDRLAADLGTNPNKLKRAFKEVFGITMAGYCLERRMREAQQLLLEAKLSVAQVAERVGYGHQSNFTAAFSAHVGMSPSEYRRHRAPIHLSLGDAEQAGARRMRGR
jgi:AraC-like DNA-binding protein